MARPASSGDVLVHRPRGKSPALEPQTLPDCPATENHLQSNVALSPSNNHPFPCAGAAAGNDNVWPEREEFYHCSGLTIMSHLYATALVCRLWRYEDTCTERSQPERPWRSSSSSSMLTSLPTLSRGPGAAHGHGLSIPD